VISSSAQGYEKEFLGIYGQRLTRCPAVTVHTLSRLKLTGPGCVLTKVLGFWSQGQWGQHPCQAGLAFMSRAMWLLFSEHPQRRHAVKGVSLGECPPQQMEPECEWSHRGGIHCPTGHNGHVVVRSSRNQVLALLEATCTYRHLHPASSTREQYSGRTTQRCKQNTLCPLRRVARKKMTRYSGKVHVTIQSPPKLPLGA